MKTLEETALAFAKKVMGWDKPVDRRSRDWPLAADKSGPSKAWDPYLFDEDAVHHDFYYTDLDLVMEQAVEWANRHRLAWLRLDYSMPDRCYYAKVRGGVFQDFEACAQNSGPCHALMAACVDAAETMQSTRTTKTFKEPI